MQKLEPENSTILICIADHHAITLPQNPRDLRQHKQEMFASVIASGIDPERCILFEQSDVGVKEHTELAWIFNCIASMGQLNRMTQWKSKFNAVTGDQDEAESLSLSNLKLGLFAYPILQAADILLYRATHVPVGQDQHQHLELARQIARTFNNQFKSEVFLDPQAISSSSTSRIMSLRDPTKKMSKSHPDIRSRILITDSPDTIRKKIAGAVTDSVLGITWDPENRPGVANLLSIMNALDGNSGVTPSGISDETTIEQKMQLAEKLAACDHKDLKAQVAEVVIESLENIRSEWNRLMGDPEALKNLSYRNAGRARLIAQSTMSGVKENIEIVRVFNMVLHKDKWKAKASRAYHRKHKTMSNGPKQEPCKAIPPAVTDDDKQRAISTAELDNSQSFEDESITSENISSINLESDGSDPSDKEDSAETGLNIAAEKQTEDEILAEDQSKNQFSRRRIIESNSWRYEEFIPDPHLPQGPAQSEEDIDYAHLPAREFEINTPNLPLFEHDRRHLKHEMVKSTRIQFVDRSEYTELKTNIDNANAVRAFRERFGTQKHHRGDIALSEQPQSVLPDDKIEDEEFDDFMSSLSLQKEKPNFGTEAKLCGLLKQTGSTEENGDQFLDSLLNRR
ncbi:Tryptophan--tRNA ligase, mitochondrial [Neolecta irregularis DAH-3]|uniref:tryptophan--tRNA ligase n=1 Tax=Neolecta irregularis (strain DAH-3) TaxID=1198029 RepID=A0A1U7LXA0_NEOID|nr:Tryptophan--tRNA ligase, mitochondrial [Neolecta irregularis DAH-3]|eukprot:OLL27151.1 Tryptophan--tRNA ligase, mitochondrial [Neolecta irregularis DAH-3]